MKEQARRMKLSEVCLHPWIVQYINPSPENDCALANICAAFTRAETLKNSSMGFGIFSPLKFFRS